MKEVIIDGINVAECRYYTDDELNLCDKGLGSDCEYNICDFKKIKRLEQENEKLKTNIELMQTALCAIRFSCKLKLEEGQEALHIEPIMRIIDEAQKLNEDFYSHLWQEKV